MPEQPARYPSFIARADQPLVGVITQEDGQEVVRYFTEEEAVDAAFPAAVTQQALGVVGAFSDLDWDETVEALDRIRHESKPTPPIDLDL